MRPPLVAFLVVLVVLNLVAMGFVLAYVLRPKEPARPAAPATGAPFCSSGPAQACPDRTTCPQNSTCAGNGNCTCNAGFVGVTCGGEDCAAGRCKYPDWWCAPRAPGACGARNFTVSCGDKYCPSDSDCVDHGTRCQCRPGFVSLSCAGVPCSTSKCEYPFYWCAPFTPGACGARNFTVSCGHLTCPTHAVCGDYDGACKCSPGFVAVDCEGKRCGKCSFPGWMCRPAPPAPDAALAPAPSP